jgi:hypothetical protein
LAGGNKGFLLAVIDVEIDLKTKTHIFEGRGRPFHEHHSSVVVSIALDALQNATVFIYCLFDSYLTISNKRAFALNLCSYTDISVCIGVRQ